MWRKEIKVEKEVGKDQNCEEGWNSRMWRENNKIVEERIKKEKNEEEEGKILKLWRRE